MALPDKGSLTAELETYALGRSKARGIALDEGAKSELKTLAVSAADGLLSRAGTALDPESALAVLRPEVLRNFDRLLGIVAPAPRLAFERSFAPTGAVSAPTLRTALAAFCTSWPFCPEPSKPPEKYGVDALKQAALLSGQLATLAAALITLTATVFNVFLKPDDRPISMVLLGAWVCFLATVGIGIWVQMNIVGSLAVLDRGETGVTANDRNIRVPAQIMCWLFGLGLVLLILVGGDVIDLLREIAARA